jgi:predicted DNA-binding helix-hairpin-helix protein
MPVGIPGGAGISDPRLPLMGFQRPEIPGLPPAQNDQPAAQNSPAIAQTGLAGAPRFLMIREHRLYQADWLLRFYQFTPDEVLEGDDGFLDSSLDPKTAWALRHLDFFPVEVNRGSYEELLRVPGIGAKSGRRIIETRRSRALDFDNLHRLGVVLKRARHFITAAGTFLDRPENPKRIRRLLSDEDCLQPLLFEF